VVEPPPIELAVDEEAGGDRVDDADRRHLGRGGDALDHRGANEKRQREGGEGDEEGPQHLARRCPHDAYEIFAA
jgi:hypothetical protein